MRLLKRARSKRSEPQIEAEAGISEDVIVPMEIGMPAEAGVAEETKTLRTAPAAATTPTTTTTTPERAIVALAAAESNSRKNAFDVKVAHSPATRRQRSARASQPMHSGPVIYDPVQRLSKAMEADDITQHDASFAYDDSIYADASHDDGLLSSTDFFAQIDEAMHDVFGCWMVPTPKALMAERSRDRDNSSPVQTSSLLFHESKEDKPANIFPIVTGFSSTTRRALVAPPSSARSEAPSARTGSSLVSRWDSMDASNRDPAGSVSSSRADQCDQDCSFATPIRSNKTPKYKSALSNLPRSTLPSVREPPPEDSEDKWDDETMDSWGAEASIMSPGPGALRLTAEGLEQHERKTSNEGLDSQPSKQSDPTHSWKPKKQSRKGFRNKQAEQQIEEHNTKTRESRRTEPEQLVLDRPMNRISSALKKPFKKEKDVSDISLAPLNTMPQLNYSNLNQQPQSKFGRLFHRKNGSSTVAEKILKKERWEAIEERVRQRIEEETERDRIERKRLEYLEAQRLREAQKTPKPDVEAQRPSQRLREAQKTPKSDVEAQRPSQRLREAQKTPKLEVEAQRPSQTQTQRPSQAQTQRPSQPTQRPSPQRQRPSPQRQRSFQSQKASRADPGGQRGRESLRASRSDGPRQGVETKPRIPRSRSRSKEVSKEKRHSNPPRLVGPDNTRKGKGPTDTSSEISSQASVARSVPLCVVCGKRERTHIATPCMHFSFCETCCDRMRKQKGGVKMCPVCRMPNVKFAAVSV